MFITETIPSEKKVNDLEHKLLYCLSGIFTNSQLGWHISSKEAYPLYKALRSCHWLLANTQLPVRVWTDHRNLLFFFKPLKMFSKPTSQRLLRWGLELQGINYEIGHIAGDDNDLADYVSRNFVTIKKVVPTFGAIRLKETVLDEAEKMFRKHRIQGILNSDYLWPTDVEILQEQQGVLQNSTVEFRKGRIYIPKECTTLILKLVVLHFLQKSQNLL